MRSYNILMIPSRLDVEMAAFHQSHYFKEVDIWPQLFYFRLNNCRRCTRVSGRAAIARQGGQQERKGTEDHIQQIFTILLPNHVLLTLLGAGFVLIRE